MQSSTVKYIKKHRLICILRGIPLQKAVPVAEALYAAGIRLLEVTFDQSDTTSLLTTPKAIHAIRERLGSDVLVGAGTVMNTAQLHAAADSGAAFALAPDTNARVIEAASLRGLVAIPGALTPTEIATAHALGAGFVKLFPAGTLGAGYIKAIRAPISHVPLMAVGGINENNLQSFFAAGVGSVGIGSNIVRGELVQRESYAEITHLAALYTAQLNVGGQTV